MNNKKIFFIACAVVIALVGLYIATTALFVSKQNNPPPVGNGNQNGQPQPTQGIVVTSPKPNELISSPLTITGMVKGEGWNGFEGQVGTVRLFDSQKKELALGILTASGDWMQLPTNFETKLFFDYPGEGNGTLVFYNENASGEPQRDKTFTVPVRLQKSSSEKTVLNVYFSTTKDIDQSCDAVSQVKREVPRTQAVAKAALEELLKGPSDQEQAALYVTNINPGVKIQDLKIENGTARVDFSKELNEGVAGSCRVEAIRAQITQTLKQFPTVQNVIISVNGRTEDILQP